jgi:hypothetical protein
LNNEQILSLTATDNEPTPVLTADVRTYFGVETPSEKSLFEEFNSHDVFDNPSGTASGKTSWQ